MRKRDQPAESLLAVFFGSRLGLEAAYYKDDHGHDGTDDNPYLEGQVIDFVVLVITRPFRIWVHGSSSRWY